MDEQLLYNVNYITRIIGKMNVATSYQLLYETAVKEGASETAKMTLFFLKRSRDAIQDDITDIPKLNGSLLGEDVKLKKLAENEIQTIDQLLKANNQ